MNELDRGLRPMAWWLARWADYQRWPPLVLENWIVGALNEADRRAAQVQLRWEGERRERKRAAGS